jgi:hypothetical protein
MAVRCQLRLSVRLSGSKVRASVRSQKGSICYELSQYRNGDASKIERKPVQLVVLIQESKAKERRKEGKLAA